MGDGIIIVYMKPGKNKIPSPTGGWDNESEPVWLLSNWMYACVPTRVPHQYFLPNHTDLSSVESVVLPAMQYPICRITCNAIPYLSYYLQCNTLSVVLPAMQYPICRITCNAIPNLTCNKILDGRITCNEIPNLSYYLQCNTQSYLHYDTICRITCNEILISSYYLQCNIHLTCNVILCRIVVLPAIQYLIYPTCH